MKFPIAHMVPTVINDIAIMAIILLSNIYEDDETI